MGWIDDASSLILPQLRGWAETTIIKGVVTMEEEVGFDGQGGVKRDDYESPKGTFAESQSAAADTEDDTRGN
jgi:hypothetical protein